MTNAVDVSVLNAKVVCTPDGTAVHVFTLTNPSTLALTVHLSIQADAGAGFDGFTLTGSPQRTVRARGAEQVVVQTRLPAGTTAGQYTFQVVVRDAQRAGDVIGCSPRAAVLLNSSLSARPPGLEPEPGRWSRVLASGLGGWKRRFALPALGPLAIDSPNPATLVSSSTQQLGGMAKGLLGLFVAMFLIALGQNVASAFKPVERVEQVDTINGPPDHWITDLAEMTRSNCVKSLSDRLAEASAKRKAAEQCKGRDRAEQRQCEVPIKAAVVKPFGCAGRSQEYWEE